MNDKYIIYFISKTKKKMVRFLEMQLADRGLGDLEPTCGNVLTVLYNHEGELSIKEIGDIVGKEKSTMTTLVNKLEAKGYVLKMKSEEDRRVINVKLTKKGRSIEDRFNDISDNVRETAYRGFSAKEKAELLRLLKKLYSNF